MEGSKLFAVFGNPILHSKSPQLFNTAFDALNFDGFYTRIRIESAKDVVDTIKTIPLDGANITAPFKEDMLNVLEMVSDEAKRIGAVNTIVSCNGRLVGHNTDHKGVTESLFEVGISIKKSKCLVLGAGGAARAAVYGLMSKGAEVAICNRTLAKAHTISKDFGCDVIDWNDFTHDQTFDVVVSTLLPEAEPHFLEDVDFDFLLDASYKDSLTSEIAMDCGARIIPGEKWLLHQAAEGFRLLTGIEPPIRTMEQGFRSNLVKENIKTLFYPHISVNEIKDIKADLVIALKDQHPDFKNRILNEEICKAFGC